MLCVGVDCTTSTLVVEFHLVRKCHPLITGVNFVGFKLTPKITTTQSTVLGVGRVNPAQGTTSAALCILFMETGCLLVPTWWELWDEHCTTGYCGVTRVPHTPLCMCENFLCDY